MPDSQGQMAPTWDKPHLSQHLPPFVPGQPHQGLPAAILALAAAATAIAAAAALACRPWPGTCCPAGGARLLLLIGVADKVELALEQQAPAGDILKRVLLPVQGCEAGGQEAGGGVVASHGCARRPAGW